MEKADALAEGRIAGFPLNDADATCEAHDDEVGFDRVVVEIEEQLEQAGGGPEEWHLAAPEIGPERIEVMPELIELPDCLYPARNLKAFEVGGERTAIADDAIERVGALDDAGDFAAEAEMTKPAPIAGKDEARVTAGEHGGVETGEGILEEWRLDQLANQRRARPLAVGDGDADTTHDFTVTGKRLRRAPGAMVDGQTPAWRCAKVAMLPDQPNCPIWLAPSCHNYGERTTAKAEWLWMLSWFTARTSNQVMRASSFRKPAALRTTSSTKTGLS